MAENLASLERDLRPAELARLDEVSRIDLGFPHTFLVDEEVEDLIFGRTLTLIDSPRTSR
jgi:hypothetical protein